MCKYDHFLYTGRSLVSKPQFPLRTEHSILPIQGDSACSPAPFHLHGWLQGTSLWPAASSQAGLGGEVAISWCASPPPGSPGVLCQAGESTGSLAREPLARPQVIFSPPLRHEMTLPSPPMPWGSTGWSPVPTVSIVIALLWFSLRLFPLRVRMGNNVGSSDPSGASQMPAWVLGEERAPHWCLDPSLLSRFL